MKVCVRAAPAASLLASGRVRAAATRPTATYLRPASKAWRPVRAAPLGGGTWRTAGPRSDTLGTRCHPTVPSSPLDAPRCARTRALPPPTPTAKTISEVAFLGLGSSCCAAACAAAVGFAYADLAPIVGAVNADNLLPAQDAVRAAVVTAKTGAVRACDLTVEMALDAHRRNDAG